MLHSRYSATEIYHPDKGLTLRQIKYLAQAIDSERNIDLSHLLRSWSSVGPLLAAVVAHGFTGQNGVVVEDQMRQLARAAGILSGEIDPDYVAPAKERFGEAMNHPLFTTNIPQIAAAFGVEPDVR